MKYLKSFLPKETLLDTIVLLISILPIEKRAFMLVKIMFFSCSFTKLYRFFIHLKKYFKKAFIIFIFYNILLFSVKSTIYFKFMGSLLLILLIIQR